MEVTDSDKYSSVLRSRFNYSCKKLYDRGPRCLCYETFFCLSLTKRQKARVLFLGKLFQSGLILVVTASSLTLMGETCRFSTGVTSGLIFKYKTRLGRFAFFMTLIC